MKKQELIDAAIQVIQEDGVHQLSLAKIAEKVGITKPAIFYHFKNKQDLMMALTHFTVGEYEKMIAVEYEKISEDDALRHVHAFLKGNLRQLNDSELIKVHAASMEVLVSNEEATAVWQDVYHRELGKMAPEIGEVRADLLSVALDGMWYGAMCGVWDAKRAEAVILYLEEIINQE
ncbi:TetR/AcrR family transcriptional regulator [Paenilisteria rocourtiae]|uniref:TetR family transcriptional regulator n=1 Tax=Listeria rocourtiae TaxID=647910 RepID=A0A4R6ZL00_9LIST|nr:TetR/AcrR family transcriptional regulator [Listeria rocourtiae]EUJ42962.1 TetR family transcriptional regulator [Listeria rocourtiae FSL F6-920]MBC1435002.1 TetR/AcrR family transcriptional regulator [Listeria rocourtiae]MBC1604817.1 TetR/AcrR family transcriptional regulator [Listeria rocourtiae]TDR53097.1 TetR family transcriptional regulator [Listeria rocourtiae]